jgi:hypothetical protein
VTAPNNYGEELCDRYLEEYRVRQFRTPDTVGGGVKNLRAYFGEITAEAITTAHLQHYQAAPRRDGAAANVNRETAALKRMFRLAIAGGPAADDAVFYRRLA